MEHDYAAVRASMEKGVFNHADADTIIHALRFAEKMCGNLSQDTIQAGIDSYNQNGHLAIVSHFKAMRDQALKELVE